jgi:hypothetical protein
MQSQSAAHDFVAINMEIFDKQRRLVGRSADVGMVEMSNAIQFPINHKSSHCFIPYREKSG